MPVEVESMKIVQKGDTKTKRDKHSAKCARVESMGINQELHQLMVARTVAREPFR